jgi:hypothetical protein
MISSPLCSIKRFRRLVMFPFKSANFVSPACSKLLVACRSLITSSSYRLDTMPMHCSRSVSISNVTVLSKKRSTQLYVLKYELLIMAESSRMHSKYTFEHSGRPIVTWSSSSWCSLKLTIDKSPPSPANLERPCQFDWMISKLRNKSLGKVANDKIKQLTS